jgi:hypothetical protein
MAISVKASSMKKKKKKKLIAVIFASIYILSLLFATGHY